SLFPDFLSAAGTFFAFTQHVFSFLALGNVDDVSQHECAFIRLNRIETDLNWHFSAVLAPAIQITARAHRARGRLLNKARSMFRMNGAITFGHELFDRMSEQLRARVAEELFGLGIDEVNAALFIDHHHSAGRRFNNDAKSFLAGAYCFNEPR